MTHRIWFFLLLASVLPVHAARVIVTHAAYKGWPDAYRLSNKTVDVVVVPGIGRIMAFGFAGHPETSPLFNNPPELGKLPKHAPGVYPSDWANFGGDKLWPSQQSNWPLRQPKGWPPDPHFDQGPYTVTRLPNGVRLTGPVSPYYRIRVVREITLPPHGAQVNLRDTFLKSRAGAGTRDDLPVGIWSVSQVRGDATVYLPLNKRGLFPGVGLTSLGDTPTLLSNWRVRGHTVAVTRTPNSNQGTKMGVDDAAGWMTCVFGGNVMFSEHFTRDPGATYPDKGCNAEVYTNGNPAYIEMEILGPMIHLRPGQRLTRTLFWRLQRLPGRPGADARRLAAAMRSPH